MELVVGAVVALLALAGLWVVVTYNGLKRLQYACADAWSLCDVQLQRRADLVPNLVSVVQAYAAHERAVLEAVAQARAAADPLHEPSAAHAVAENRLGAAIAQTVALREGYPELAASQQFGELQKTLVDLEDQIAASREIYNANVRVYRDRLQTVPSSLVASQFRFEDRPMFEVELAVERAPAVVRLPQGSAPRPGSTPPPSSTPPPA